MKPMQQLLASFNKSQAIIFLTAVSAFGAYGNVYAQTTAVSSQSLCCDKTASGVCVQPMPARPSPSRVNESGRYSDLHIRMDKLDTGNCANAYFLHKTQAWLNLSRDLYHEGDGATAVNAAFDEAEKLIKSLENGKEPSLATEMIENAAKLRPDLWELAANRKMTPTLLSSAAREVAYCEVYLVRAGHAHTNLGGKARIEPLIGMAQDICFAAKDKAPCFPTALPIVAVVTPVPAIVVEPAPLIVATKTAPVMTTYILGADALFNIDKAIVKPEGKAKIDAMLNSLKSTTYSKIIVIGHTDADASDAYNNALSVRRAIAVKVYLLSKGVNGNLVEVSGMGERQPIADNKTVQGKAQNRRVEIEVIGVKK
jgi:outer membrane protein OmpA-like peptidoglycan-associated protein